MILLKEKNVKYRSGKIRVIYNPESFYPNFFLKKRHLIKIETVYQSNIEKFEKEAKNYFNRMTPLKYY